MKLQTPPVLPDNADGDSREALSGGGEAGGGGGGGLVCAGAQQTSQSRRVSGSSSETARQEPARVHTFVSWRNAAPQEGARAI
jgi:hypothetical protein